MLFEEKEVLEDYDNALYFELVSEGRLSRRRRRVAQASRGGCRGLCIWTYRQASKA